MSDHHIVFQTWANHGLLDKVSPSLDPRTISTLRLPVEDWGQLAKFVTIRRWQVKRTEVTESCLVSYTDYITRNIQTIVMLLKYTFGWCMSIPVGTNSSIYPIREEAEAAARKWLRDNGYRIRKVAT